MSTWNRVKCKPASEVSDRTNWQASSFDLASESVLDACASDPSGTVCTTQVDELVATVSSTMLNSELPTDNSDRSMSLPDMTRSFRAQNKTNRILLLLLLLIIIIVY